MRSPNQTTNSWPSTVSGSGDASLDRVALQLGAVEDQPLAQRPVVSVARFGGAAAVGEVARDEAEGRRVDAERDGDGALVTHHAEQAGARGGDARGRRMLDDLAADVDEEREADELPARELRVRPAAVPLVELGGDARLPRRHRRARLRRRRARRDVRRVEVDRLLQPDRDDVGPRRHRSQSPIDSSGGGNSTFNTPTTLMDCAPYSRRRGSPCADTHCSRMLEKAPVGLLRRAASPGRARRPPRTLGEAPGAGSRLLRRRPRRSLPIMMRRAAGAARGSATHFPARTPLIIHTATCAAVASPLGPRSAPQA